MVAAGRPLSCDTATTTTTTTTTTTATSIRK